MSVAGSEPEVAGLFLKTRLRVVWGQLSFGIFFPVLTWSEKGH